MKKVRHGTAERSTPLYALLDSIMRREAKNGPAAFLTDPGIASGRKVVVCIGDSITRGQVSCNYVEALAGELGRTFYFVNAGVNGELSFNVLDRIDAVRRCAPDYATLLIGTNDAHAMISPRSAERARHYMLVAETPSLDTYRKNLRLVVDRLREGSSVRVALLSIPPIGETLGDQAMRTAERFARAARSAAAACSVAYLPLFEEMTARLEGEARPGANHSGYADLLLLKNLIATRLLRRSYDAVAERRGFALHTDLLHLNCRGAASITRLISSFLVQAGAGNSIPDSKR